MGGSLVGEDVGDDAALGEFRNDVGAIADESDRNVFFLAHRVLQDAQSFVERGDHEVAVAGLEPLLDALGIDVDAEKRRAGHGGGQRLGAAHASHAAADDQFAGEVAVETLFRSSGESFEGSLHDALRADINPGAGGHLAVHHQAGAFEFVELFPVGPVADEIRVRDQHARRVFVGLENADRLAGLHEQSFVVVEALERGDDGVVGLPTAGGAAGAAIDDEVARALGDFFVEIVHQHAHGGFLLPAFAGNRIAARGADGRVGGLGDFGFNRHEVMVVVWEEWFKPAGCLSSRPDSSLRRRGSILRRRCTPADLLNE